MGPGQERKGLEEIRFWENGWMAMTKTSSVHCEDMKKVLSEAQLPALPHSAIRLLELSRNPENGPAEYAQPIAADPGLSSQVLRFVNSSYFGFSREISNIKQAITLVGVRTIKNFALWSAVFSLLPNPKCGPFDLKCLWQDSLRRALFARVMGRLLSLKETEDIFTAALLQDLAVPILAKEKPVEYRRLLEESMAKQTPLSLLEQETFGWSHAQAGGFLLRQWHLPENFAELVEGHTALERWLESPTSEGSRLAVALSALLPTVRSAWWYEVGRLEEAYGKVIPARVPSLEQILIQIDKDFADFAPILNITNPPQSLAVTYQKALASVG